MYVRRVVTGHDDEGKSLVAADEELAPIQPKLFPGFEFHRVWGADSLPGFPDAGTEPKFASYFPPRGGLRFVIFTLPPSGDAERLPTDQIRPALSELGELLPGLLDFNEPGDSGFHTTPTIDFEVVLHGEVTLELEDGVTILLRRGDTVVQNGTRHRWLNLGSEPASLAIFVYGVQHDGIISNRAAAASGHSGPLRSTNEQ